MTADSKALYLYPIDYPFETLVDRVNSGNLILNPELQQIYQWDNERASRFIESALMRMPLPPCFFIENADNKHEVIDGVQRITTIYRFLNNEFALEGLTIFKELENKRFKELRQYKSDLEMATIRCVILRKNNNIEMVTEIFTRLNQGAVKLTAQEIRHVLFSGSFDKLLTALAQIPMIEKFSNDDKNRRQAEEMVLRFFATNNDLKEYEGKMSKHLDVFMEKNRYMTQDTVSELSAFYNCG